MRCDCSKGATALKPWQPSQQPLRLPWHVQSVHVVIVVRINRMVKLCMFIVKLYIYNKLYNYKQFQGWACLSMFEQLHQLSTPMIPSMASRNSGRQGVKWARWWGAKLPQHWKHTMNQNNQKASKKNVILVHSMFKLDDGWPESEKDVFQAALGMVVVKDSRWIVGEFYWWIFYELWKDMM